MSPFSSEQKYTLQTYPYTARVPGNLTPWEQETLYFLKQVGAAAYFQITYKSKQKHKLDALNRAGLLRKYQLQGKSPINVAATRKYEIPELLKTLIFTQLVLRLKENFPDLTISPGDNLVHSVLTFNERNFPVIVLRQSDNLYFFPKEERMIIISETFHPSFSKINTPVRIALDEELLSEDSLIFHLPDGSRQVL